MACRSGLTNLTCSRDKGSAMAKFEYTSTADGDAVHLVIDAVFQLTITRIETGIEIDVLDDRNGCLDYLFVENPDCPGI